jgi:hypothetical protein
MVMTTRIPMLAMALLATLSLSACGGGGDDAADGPAPSPSPTTADETAVGGTPIRIAVGDTELTARLDDNATARELAAQLPLTLTFRDHNNVEKTAPLPRELSLERVPEGHDPAAGEIGYWAPDGDLVFYYDSDAPYFDGIVRIGEFDGSLEAIERQSDDFEVTIERAE